MIDYKEFKRLSESAIQDNEILDEAAWTKKGWQEQRRLEIPVGHPFVLE